MDSNPSLFLSHDNLRNTTLDCDALGIHYQVSSEKHHLITGKNTKVHRWDKQSGQNVLVAEWERRNFHSDEFKFPNATGGVTVPVSTFMKKHHGLFKTEWSFVGDDGRRYTWREKAHLCFVSDNDEEGEQIARFHGRTILIHAHKAYLELFPGFERTLNTLVLTFLYVEEKRREQQEAAASAAAAASG
ncbi:hypothetical protein SCHPADRAFT_28935 [Schizopora paradoxa]|uniref:DUF6593 domain-containing protein n=1 Tax=Schizopora paradoxa TaxID=27342 RepID=A0A0H2S790_9AGAM|nr:hypothetical protein SCHPADRAFT_28935 [Schizopora paradoxa]